MRILRYLGGLILEFFAFARQNKVWWIVPMVFFLLILMLLITTAQVTAPQWIYTLF